MAQAGSLERLYQTYKDRVAFLLVYIAEAHPGSIVSVPTKEGGKELQIIPPTATVGERLRNLRQFVALAGLTMPAVIDSEENAAKHAYAAWPDRLYVIGVDGKVAYKSAPGPRGFKVPELADWLSEHIQ
jgi:hypothetical protein